MQPFTIFKGLEIEESIIMKHLFIGLFGLFCWSASAQITVTNTQTPVQLVTNVLTGTGITVSNVEFNGSLVNALTVQTQVGFFDATGTTFPIPTGVILATGNTALAVGPNNIGSATDNSGVAADPNDPDLAAISNATYNNEAILEFDFVPVGDSLEFNFIFASEEYHEYSLGINDGFAFFISGPGFSGPYTNGGENIALIPGTTTPVTMFNLNNGTTNAGPCVNCQYLIDNTGGQDVQYDAYTTTLKAAASVQCGQTYHIKLAIGDASDQAWDSGVFFEANSFSSALPEVSILPVDENGDIIEDGALPEGCIDASLLLIKPVGYTDSTYVMDLTIGGTAINGTDYTQLSPSYTIPVGVDTLEVVIDAFLDGLTEGTETLIISTFFLSPCGDTLYVIDTLNIIDVAPNYNLVFDDTILDCPQDSILLVVTTDGGIPNIHYDWLTTGDTLGSVWVPANVVGTTAYPVQATDFCGITSLDTISVTLNPSILPEIFFQDDSILTCVGQNGVDLEAIAVTNVYDPDSLTYDWSPTASDSAMVTVFPMSNLNWYYLTVYDGCNTVTDSVFVEVEEAELDSIIAIQAEGCVGQNAVLGSVTVYPNDPGWTYTLVGNANTYGPTSNNFFDNLAGNITYALIASDPDGCIADTSVFVGLAVSSITADFIDLSLQDISCFGAADGQAEVQNISGGLNTPTPGPFTLVWSHVGGGPTITVPNLALGGGDLTNSLVGGNWEVLVTEQGSGCAWSHLFTINEPSPLTMTTNSNEPECFGTSTGSLTIFGDGGTQPYSYEILDINDNVMNIGNSNTANSLPTGWYFFEVTDAEGCTAEDSIFLDQPGPIDIDFTVQDIICYGRNTGSIVIDTVYNFSGNYDDIGFYWDPNTSGNTDPFGHNAEYNLAPGEYVVEIYSGNCYNSFTIFVKDTAEIVLELGLEPAYCRTKGYQSGNGEIYGSATGGALNFTFEWENIITGEKNTNTTWAGLNPGTYQFTAVDQNGCIKAEIIQLDSLNPIASFTPESDDFEGPGQFEGTEELEVQFINESLNFANPNNPLSDTTFKWNLYTNDPNGGGTWFFSYDYDEKIDTTYNGEEDYLVCLVAKNFNDCRDTFCHSITVHDFPELLTPNVFTPGESPNSEFFFPSVAMEEFEASVFNRYGVEVFRFTSIDDKWDGNNFKNGKPCTEGIYYYSYTATSSNGTPFEGQGNVYLIRPEE